MTGVEFHALHRERCRTGSSPSTVTRSGRGSSRGKATRAQVLGFAFEKYHYIEAAFEHMGDRRRERDARR